MVIDRKTEMSGEKTGQDVFSKQDEYANVGGAATLARHKRILLWFWLSWYRRCLRSKIIGVVQQLLLIWPNGRFQHQRSAVRIQSLFTEHLLTVNCIEKTKIKKVDAGNDISNLI